MTRKRAFWFAYAACVGLAVFWGIRLLTPRHRINYENYGRIQVGMTLKEVEAIVGVPPGDYSTRGYRIQGWPISTKHVVSEPPIQWIGNDGGIGVTLDRQGNVGVRRWTDSITNESFFDRVRGWFGAPNYGYHSVLRIR